MRFRIFRSGSAVLALSVALGLALGRAEPPTDNTPTWAAPLLNQVKLTPAKLD